MLRSFLVALCLAAPPALAQSGGVGFASSDGRVVVTVEPKIHADVRAFPGGPTGGSPGFLLRRARFELAAEIDGRYRVVLEPGFGEGEVEILDGYVGAALGGGVEAQVGRFKTPVGYESLLSSSDLRFAERALPTALSPRRDLGAMLTWEAEHVEAQAGLFNGVPDGSSANRAWGAGPDAAARVFARPGGPLDGLGVGVAVAAGTERGTDDEDDLADYETSGDRTFFDYAPGVRADGARLRLAPQATLDVGPLYVLGEWTLARHRLAGPGGGDVTVAHRAWQAAASVVLVGEPQGAERPVPRRSLTAGGAGAVEVSARVHGLHVDPDAAPLAAAERAQRALAWALAAHWSPVAAVRLGVTVERTALDGFGDAAGPPDETLVVGRVQIDL
ncbi:porin [Rubrivirga sp. S365]|uniref:Porin n=1 Tax=Rubrivirga litoralis TaxID=3075598 RepID=A0ABU3BNF0_9BACT|nr:MULTISPECIES: porin [unclassified Rubrivirga]MDT0630817.1 porin [Rubrivirga sp. F394]MDT7857369.1 porin [Rubrivirga sp. S365]